MRSRVAKLLVTALLLTLSVALYGAHRYSGEEEPALGLEGLKDIDLSAAGAHNALYQRALARLEERLAHYPDDYEASLLKGLIYFKSGRLPEAQQELAALIRREPKFHLAYLVQGDLLLAQTQTVTDIGATPVLAGLGKEDTTLEQLRALDVQGEAKVGKLKVMNLRSTDIHATLNAKDGLIRVYPVGAKLYDGSYQGNLTFDVRGATPLSSMDEKLTGVQAGPLLKDFMGKDYVTGTGSVSAKLTARGIDPMEARKSLNGNVAFSFENGAVNGINIAQLIRNAYAAYKKQPPPKDEVKQTDFAAITGTATVKDGLVTNNDLSAKSPLLRVDGKGTANLVSEALDYRVSAAIVGTLEGQGGKDLEELKGLAIPVHIGGTFRDPKFNVELGALLDAKAKQQIEAEKKKAQEQVNKKIEQEKKNLQKELEKQFKLKF